jgi:hypothetical protein
MPHVNFHDTIAVNDAAAMVPIGPRRFRQLAGLETPEGKEKLGLTYVHGRAHIRRDQALVLVGNLRAAREQSDRLPQDNLSYFAERNERDPESGARICLAGNCNQHVTGRGKLCLMHSLERAKRRLERRSGKYERPCPESRHE